MERNRMWTVVGAMAAAAGMLTSAAWGQVNNPEAEINDNKASANAVSSGGAGMINGDYITGTSTGTSTSLGGAINTADYFRVRTALAAPGVYRHRLTLTSEIAGHIGTIRGLNQSGGVIGATDSTVQTTSTATNPPRFNQWYGFGKGEEIYYRVTGTTSSTEQYTSTLETTPVFVNDVFGSVYSGTVTLSTVGQTTTDTDFWVYDSNFNAIAQWGNDDEGPSGPTLQSRIIRDMTPGTYYLAITNYNFANNMPSDAPDEDFRTGIVLDFPDACTNSSTTVGGNLTFSLLSDAGEVITSLFKNEPYEVVFARFVVTDNPGGTPPIGVGSVNIASADNCGAQSALYTVSVTPGSNPPSTGLAVTGDFSSLGGSSFQAMFDDGTNGDVTPGDNVFSYAQVVQFGTLTGPKTVAFTVSDDQFRSRSGTISGLSVTDCVPTGVGAVSTGSVDNCGDGSATYYVSVVPASFPVSTGITVTGDFSSLGGSSFQAMFDDGTNGDAFPGDNVFTYTQQIAWGTTTGAKTVPFTVSDAQFRSSNGTITGLTVAACTRLGACCLPAGCQTTSQTNCQNQGGTYSGDGTNCGVPSYTVSTSAGAYEDISGSGTPGGNISNCDDCVQSGIPIGFDFNFFDNTYNAVNVSSNGNIQFTSALTTFTNAAIPTVGGINNMIAPFWDDLITTDASGPGDVYYLTRGTAPNREFIVSWQNVRQYTTQTSENFQAVLFEGSNNIEFRYGLITPENPAGDYSIGIEDITGTVGYSVPGFDLGSGFTARMFTYVPGTNPCGGACPWSSGGCIADYNGSGGTPDDADVDAFFTAWGNGEDCADANGSGGTPDDADVDVFFTLWSNGGC